jgi:hypothetical protein
MEIIIEPIAGLANRLRATVSGMCAAEDIGRPLTIVWEKDGHCEADFADLFEPLPAIHVTNRGVLTAGSPVECKNHAEWLGLVAKEGPLHVRSCYQFHTTDPERWAQRLRSIRPKPQFVSEIDTLFSNKHVVGVHIRRTDNSSSIRFSPTQGFIDIMKTYPPSTYFFVATDDIRELAALRALYGDRILAVGNTRDRRDMQSAIVDFIGLARSSEILGSYCSSFSDIAAIYGAIPIRILKLEGGPRVPPGTA